MPKKTTKEKKQQPNIYCSLDIETSDFDPANGEVLELGMVFFQVERDDFKILSEWQSTFKPSKEVSPRILALTGITTEELEESPLFKDKAIEIQELMKDAVIVGHNINFDIKFLEGFGIKFSGKQIDTLDFSQMMLPTNSSYNLEAMTNLLNVLHKDAHRALADAQAAMVVLKTLLQFYSTFPEALKKDLLKVFPMKEFPEIAELLQTEFPNYLVEQKEKAVEIETSPEINEVIKQERGIITFPLGFNHHNYVYGAIAKSKEKILLVVNNKQTVYQLWKQKVAYPIFDNKDVFNEDAFNAELKGDLTLEQRFFFGKIMVWKHTNWQAQVLCDINFSFGNQFKNLINCSASDELVWKLDDKPKVVVTDYADFIEYDLEEVYANRKLVVLDLNNFEQSLTYSTSKKVSWNDFIYAFKQIYDPVSGSGKNNLKEIISESLA